MSRMKTNSAAKKRFKKNGSGTAIKRAKAYRRHLLTKKSSKQKRDLRQSAYVDASDVGRIKILLPY